MTLETLMVCMLRAGGTSFDVDAFLKNHPHIHAEAVWHRDEKDVVGRVLAESGFNLALGEVAKAQDIFAVLRTRVAFAAELRVVQLAGASTELDFGIMVTPGSPMAQLALRRAELQYCADNSLDVIVTAYAATDDDS